MKHVLLLLTLGILCPFLLPAQNTVFAPEGAVWRYNMYTFNTTYGVKQYRYVAAADTFIFGKNARIMQGEIWTDGEIFVKGNTTRIACDSVVATYTPLLPGFSIGPNPFTAELNLVVPAHSYPDLQFTLYHYSGQEISRSSLMQGDNVLRTGPLPAGFYFWEIRSGARVLGNGKLVHSSS